MVCQWHIDYVSLVIRRADLRPDESYYIDIEYRTAETLAETLLTNHGQQQHRQSNMVSLKEKAFHA